MTPVGDAAHLMTPFACERVNLAHAIRISTTNSELDFAVRTFEVNMFERAKAVTQNTYDMMHIIYLTPGSPRNNIEQYLLRAVHDEIGRWVIRLMRLAVCGYCFVFKLIW